MKIYPSFYWRAKDYLENVILKDLRPTENITNRIVDDMAKRIAFMHAVEMEIGTKKTMKIWRSLE